MPAADTVLRIWERVQHCSPPERGLRFLALALPDHDRETLACFDLGLRDWHVLRLRLALFGDALSGCAACPACGEQLELEFDGRLISDDSPDAAPPFISAAGRRFRLPTTADLLAVAADDEAAAARRLFDRCSLDGPAPRDDDSTLFEQVDTELAALARARGIHLELSCTRCGESSTHALDPGEFLWHELAACAASLLDEVHRLAQAYGWPERDILALSAARRAAYLSRVP